MKYLLTAGLAVAFCAALYAIKQFDRARQNLKAKPYVPMATYFCSASEIEYVETERGLSVLYDKYGVPVSCE